MTLHLSQNPKGLGKDVRMGAASLRSKSRAASGRSGLAAVARESRGLVRILSGYVRRRRKALRDHAAAIPGDS
jgi:hypothetical protein